MDCLECGGAGVTPLTTDNCPLEHGWWDDLRYAHCHILVCSFCEPKPDMRGAIMAGNHHKETLVRKGTWAAWVDEGIAGDIRMLWDANISTWVSCEGPDDRYIGLVNAADVAAASALISWAHDVDVRGWSTFIRNKTCLRKRVA